MPLPERGKEDSVDVRPDIHAEEACDSLLQAGEHRNVMRPALCEVVRAHRCRHDQLVIAQCELKVQRAWMVKLAAC